MAAVMHTPGPWTIPTPRMGFSEIRGCDGQLVFGLAAGGEDEKRPDQECEANARLIAAAPDLLKALEAVCAELNDQVAPRVKEYARAALRAAGQGKG